MSKKTCFHPLVVLAFALISLGAVGNADAIALDESTISPVVSQELEMALLDDLTLVARRADLVPYFGVVREVSTVTATLSAANAQPCFFEVPEPKRAGGCRHWEEIRSLIEPFDVVHSYIIESHSNGDGAPSTHGARDVGPIRAAIWSPEIGACIAKAWDICPAAQSLQAMNSRHVLVHLELADPAGAGHWGGGLNSLIDDSATRVDDWTGLSYWNSWKRSCSEAAEPKCCDADFDRRGSEPANGFGANENDSYLQLTGHRLPRDEGGDGDRISSGPKRLVPTAPSKASPAAAAGLKPKANALLNDLPPTSGLVRRTEPCVPCLDTMQAYHFLHLFFQNETEDLSPAGGILSWWSPIRDWNGPWAALQDAETKSVHKGRIENGTRKPESPGAC